MRKPRPALSQITRKSFNEFLANDPLRLAGATAFFTTFALPAILLIILQITRLVLTKKEGKEELFLKADEYVGKDSAKHLINVLKGFESVADNWMTMTAGFVFLIFVATTLFKVIKNSLNQIWNIEVVEKGSVFLTLKMRLRELAVIVSAGVLFLLSLGVDGMQAIVSEEFISSSPLTTIVFNSIFGFIISVVIASVWFGMIFAFLPDGRFSMGTSFMGGLVTSILFNIGKLILKSGLQTSTLHKVFGDSAAVVLLLLFVFYSSMIFYLGASFTKALGEHRGRSISTLDHASVNHKS